MIDFTMPPNLIQKEILKLPLSEQEYWINLWQAQIPPEISTVIPKYKPVPSSKDWQEVPEITNNALDRPRKGRFGKKERQEYAKTKDETEMKEFLQDPVKVKQCSKAFRSHVNKGLEKLSIIK